MTSRSIALGKIRSTSLVPLTIFLPSGVVIRTGGISELSGAAVNAALNLNMSGHLRGFLALTTLPVARSIRDYLRPSHR